MTDDLRSSLALGSVLANDSFILLSRSSSTAATTLPSTASAAALSCVVQ